MKVLLFGTGKIAHQVMEGICIYNDCIDIVGFIDNDKCKCGNQFYGKPIFEPNQIVNMQYDYICILIGEKEEVFNQLVYGYQIDKSKITDQYFLLKQIMIYKYKNIEEPDIKDTISFWKQGNDLSFFNQFKYVPETYEKVYWDIENNMPYVLYRQRKLYYPRTYKGFIVKNESLYVVSYREMEQHKLSPHRYLTDKIVIQENDVVVDAGAREGDFALPYIDIIKKLYIFECDPKWVEALKMTYKDYSEKVVIVPKLLSDTVDEMTTTLDEEIKEKRVDFIKMDIEGAEVRVLSSSQKLLKKNDLRCAICSYHRKNDRKEIENILEKNGYECSVSRGYVVFIADPSIFKEADFRKGIVYAIKSNNCILG